MNKSFTLQEIADAAAISKRAVEKRARLNDWPYTEKAARGGRQRLFDFSVLPSDIQEQLRKQAGIDAVNQHQTCFENIESYKAGAELAALMNEQRQADEDRKMAGFRQYMAMPDGPKKERVKALRWVIESLQAYRHNWTGTKAGTRHAYVKAFQNDEFEIPAWVHEHMPKYNGQRALTEASLHRWEDRYHKDGVIGLVDAWGLRRGNTIIDKNPDMAGEIIGAILNTPHVSAGDLRQLFVAKHPDQKIPSKKTIQRWMTSWKESNYELLLYKTNPDKWKNVCMVAFGSHFERIERLNQVWELDSTPGDWMLTDGRHSVIGVIDLYSRRLKLLVSKTSKSSAICQLYRRAIMDWGMNEVSRTDNGKDYVSERFIDVLSALGVTHELCLPFASEEKGTIERALQTMSHGILNLLPGFIGHNVAERKVIESRKSFAQRIMKKDEVVEVSMSSDELQEKLDQWLEYEYHKNPHSGLNNKTPFEVATAWTKPIKKIQDERALDALLMDVPKLKTMGKKGLRVDSNFYFTGALVARMGDKFRIKCDEGNMGRIYVYEAFSPEFVCVAECPQLLGISQKEAAAGMKSRQRKLLNQQSKELNKFKRDMKINIAAVVLEDKIEKAKNISVLPPKSEPYTTPELEAASIAARALDGPQTTDNDIDMEAFKVEFTQPVAVIGGNDPRANYKRWATIEKLIAEGVEVSEKDAAGLKRYQQLTEYKSMKDHFEEFGLSIEN